MSRHPSTAPLLLAVAPASIAVRLARTLAGAVLGTALGLAVSLGVVVYEARVDNRFLESTDDIMSLRAVPIPAGFLAGAIGGWGGPVLLAAGGAGGVAGGVLGALAGAAVGDMATDARSGPWAGGVMGSAVGVLLGMAAGLIWARARRRRDPPGAPRAAASAALLLAASAAWLTGCGGEAPALPEVPAAPPVGGEDVASVLFLFGDPGKARYLKYPILPKLAREVDTWSARLDRDSSVVVVALGDIIYPDGMRDPDPASPAFEIDSLRVESHIDVVRGAGARSHGARLYFLAGNHDWGLAEDRVGTTHLKNLGRFIDRARARDDVNVDLVPEAGTGMPYVVDLEHVRLVLLDTAWWIFDAEPNRKEAMLERVAEALATAGEREVIIAAHHPYASAGPHGGETTVWKDLGIRFLMARSGAMLQSLDSRVYGELHAGLQDVFARVERPLAFIGGHEHSLQVIRGDSATAPRYSMVSGSASKLTPVGWLPGMLYRRSAPGYMRVVVRKSGAVDLYVEAAPEQFLVCPDDPDAAMDWERCMEEGVASYETVFSMRLSEPGGS